MLIDDLAKLTWAEVRLSIFHFSARDVIAVDLMLPAWYVFTVEITDLLQQATEFVKLHVLHFKRGQTCI